MGAAYLSNADEEIQSNPPDHSSRGAGRAAMPALPGRRCSWRVAREQLAAMVRLRRLPPGVARRRRTL